MDQLISHYPPFDYTVASAPLKGVALCLSSGFVSDFTFSCLLIKQLKQNKRTVLISTNHPTSHYDHILRKNAMDLGNLQAAGVLQIKELKFESLINKELGNNELTWSDLEAWREEEWSTANNKFKYPSHIQEEIEETGEGFGVFIDDLEAFELLAPDESCARKWISNLCKHTKPSYSQSKNRIQCFVGFGRQSVEPHTFDMGSWNVSSHIGGGMQYVDEKLLLQAVSNGQPRISEYLKYRSDIMITTSPLASGYSQETHGTMTITSAGRLTRQSFLFKALDTGVRVNQLGSGTATTSMFR